MINAITQIGKLQWEMLEYKDREEDLLKVLTEDPSDKGKYQQAIIIQFKNQGKLQYAGAKVKEYDSRDIYRYMYKQGSSNGSDFSPTAKITEPKKTLKNKIIRRVKEVFKLKYPEEMEDQVNLISEVINIFEENHDQILNDIEDIYKKRDRDTLFLLTISFIHSDEELLPGDIEIFQKAFVHDAMRNFYYRKTGNIDTRVKSGVCSICYESEVETYGFASPFSFYTIDKPGYIAGGFHNSMISYNYPVCKSCSIWLLMGKKYLDEHLTFNAFSKTFYIIPKVFNDKLLSRALTHLDKLNDSDTFSQFRDHYLKREDIIFKYAGSMDEDCSFNFVFFREDNRSFRILLDLNDILPSRLNTIFQALNKINYSDFFYKFPMSSKKEMSISINFSWLNDVMESAGTDRYFLELFGSIISDKKIDYYFLMKFVYRELINAFNETGKMSYKLYTILSYGFLSFLHNLHLLNYNRKEEWIMNLPSKNVYDIRDYNSRREAFEAFFNDHAGFFDKPEKKAIFMIGYLTQKLLNIQMRRYDGNTPFRARLKGLKLNKRDINRLFYEIENKLDEYRYNNYEEMREFYKQERGLCAEYFIQTDNQWNIMNEEISFFVALGMNMTHCFNLKKGKENKKS